MDARTSTEARVARNVSLCPECHDRDRIAARHLFSTLAHLEAIAVLNARRGQCIDGQLEDEIVHQETFACLAGRLGGLIEPCEEVRDLAQYLASVEGPDGLVALNLVAENWLDTVFDCLRNWGICDELLATIEEDEHRHVTEASAGISNIQHAALIVGRLESLLAAIAQSAQFILPLHHFATLDRVCEMGMKLCDSHETACKRLGLIPDTRATRRIIRAVRLHARRLPAPVEMSAWDLSKQALYPHVSPMVLWWSQEVGHGGPRLLAQVTWALNRIMQRNPRLRVVCRTGSLYRCRDSIVAVRTLWDDRQVMNVLVKPSATWQHTLRQINARTKRERARNYKAIPAMRDALDELVPPSIVCCAVNYNAAGGECGYGPLSDLEGISILVTFGERVNGACTFTILMDHRTHDGQDIGLLKRELEKELWAA